MAGELIVAWTGASTTRVPGSWSGQVSYEDDIVGPDGDVVGLFDESSSDYSL